jgi:hypothetical protein
MPSIHTHRSEASFAGSATPSASSSDRRSFILLNALLRWDVQLVLLVAHLLFYILSLAVAVPPSDDGAYYAVGGWNYLERGGTGNRSFGSWQGIGESLAVYNPGGALWVGSFLHMFGPSLFVSRLSALTATLLAATATCGLYQQVAGQTLTWGQRLFVTNIYLTLPIVTLTSHECRFDQLITATLYACWLLTLRSLRLCRLLPAFGAGLLAGAGLLIHLNVMFAIPTAAVLLSVWPGPPPRRRLLLLATFGSAVLVGLLVFYAGHILPDVIRFQTQWRGIMKPGLGPPMLMWSAPRCVAEELIRWKEFYLDYPQKRFLLEPIAVAASFAVLLRHQPRGAWLVGLIAACGFAALTAAAASKWPWYIAYSGPVSAVLLAYPFLRPTASAAQRIARGLALAAITVGLANHVAWFAKGRALADSSYYPHYRSVMGPTDRMFLRGVDTYAFITEDSRVISHWFFEFYEAQARSLAGERVSMLSYLQEYDVSLILLNHHLRDFLAVQKQVPEADRTYTGLDDFLALLEPYSPTDTSHPTIYVLRLRFHEGSPTVTLHSTIPRVDGPDWRRLLPR